MTNYFYVILRKDMYPFGEENPAYLIIQASHAAFEMARRLPTPEPDEPPTSMVLLEVDDENELIEVMRELKFDGAIEGHDFYTFFEPDHRTGYSAICTRVFEGRNKYFKDFRAFGSDLIVDDIISDNNCPGLRRAPDPYKIGDTGFNSLLGHHLGVADGTNALGCSCGGRHINGDRCAYRQEN